LLSRRDAKAGRQPYSGPPDQFHSSKGPARRFLQRTREYAFRNNGDAVGLTRCKARLENSQLQLLTESRRKHGIDDGVISAAIAEAQLKSV
jgi:hypothetical protein